MTKNQIDYLRLQEAIRNNQVAEKEVGRHNKAVEELQALRDRQDYLYNMQIVQLRRDELAQQAKRDEWTRFNQQTANEIQRINVLGNLAELQRSNYAREAEILRSNQAREQEQRRSNLANEQLQRSAQAIDIARVQNQARANEINLLSLQYQREYQSAQIAESKRHNITTEKEVSLHNRQYEAIQAYEAETRRQEADTRAYSAETSRIDVANRIRATDETIRHNIQEEDIGRHSVIYSLIGSVFGSTTRMLR